MLISVQSFGLCKEQIKSLTWASASMGSSAQMMCSAIASIVNMNVPNLKLSVQTTGGSVENPRLFRDGKVDLCHTTEGYNAFTAKEVFEGEEPVELLALFKMYSNETVLVVLEDSPIQEVTDIKGKTVACGPPGSGTSQMSKGILVAYDLWENDSFKKVSLGYNESCDALKDGTVDAIFIFGSGNSLPSPALNQLDSTAKIRLIPEDDKVLQKAYDIFPGFAPSIMQAESLKALDHDVKVLASFSIEYAGKNLSEDDAYLIVKNTFENLDVLKIYHKLGSTMALEGALDGIPKDIPIHPGAAKYFKEKGVWKDDLIVGSLE